MQSKKSAVRGLKFVKNSPDKGDKAYKIINFKKVIDETGLNQDKVYNNLKGEYNSFNEDDIKKIVNALVPKLTDVFKTLGYAIRFEKLKGHSNRP